MIDPFHFSAPQRIPAYYAQIKRLATFRPLCFIRKTITLAHDTITLDSSDFDTAMLTDQNFNVKDSILVGSSLFAHPKFGVNYAAATNFKTMGILHEHADFFFTEEDPAHKILPKLAALGCPFKDSFDLVPGLTPTQLIGFKALYSAELYRDFEKRGMLSLPLSPVWLNPFGNIATVLTALENHYLFPGSDSRLF